MDSDFQAVLQTKIGIVAKELFALEGKENRSAEMIVEYMTLQNTLRFLMNSLEELDV